MAIEIVEPCEELRKKCRKVYTIINTTPDYANEEERQAAEDKVVREMVERFRNLERQKKLDAKPCGD